MFVQRDSSGAIIGVFAAEQSPDQEFLPDDSPEMIAFNKRMERAMFPSISHRQFYQVLALKGLITKNEALAAVQHGTIPEILAEHLSHLTNPDEHFAAEMLLAGATEFRRDHPLVDHFSADAGMSPDEIDTLWRMAATL